MIRITLLCLLALLIVSVPAAASEIRLIDGPTGASRTFASSAEDYTDGPGLLRWTDDGAALLLEANGDVQRVGVATGGIQDEPSFHGFESVGPGGRFVADAVGSAKHTRYRLGGPDGRRLGTFDFGASYGVPSVAWSADGTRVAVAVAPVLYVIDAETGGVVLRRRITSAEFGPQAFAPDASALLVTDNERLLRVALPAGGATVLLRTGEYDNDPPRAAWGSSGRIAVRIRERLRVLGEPAVELTMGFDSPTFMLWNPDGTALTYAFDTANGDCSPPEGLGVVVPGQAPRILAPTSDRKLLALAWSPDGRTLAVELAAKAKIKRERRGRRGRWPRKVARTYEMTSRQGDAAVREAVLRATRALRAGSGRQQTLVVIRNDLNRLAHRFASVDDSEVPEAVATELDRWLRAAGWKKIGGNSEVTCPAPEGEY